MADIIPFPVMSANGTPLAVGAGENQAVAFGGGPPQDPEMEARIAVLEQIAKSTTDALVRIERRLDELSKDLRHDHDETGKRVDGSDARLRAVEVKLGEVTGKLDLLGSKIPSWWQSQVSAGGLIALLLGAFALAQHFGLINPK